MAIKADQFKVINLTEGGADAFVEASVATELVPENGEGMLIKRIEFCFTAGLLELMSADANVRWAVTRDSKLASAAVPGYGDSDAMYSDGFSLSLTTSGQVVIPNLITWIPPEGLFVVEPYIYAQLDSNASGQALAGNMRIHYEMVKLSEVDILRMLTNA